MRNAGSRFQALCLLAVLLLELLATAGCGHPEAPTVVLYTSVDQPFSEPVVRSFEEESGIRVRAVYDLEAAKTTGLVHRLVAEAPKTRADVFWSSEIAQTLWLKRKGVLAPCKPASAGDIPAAFKDGEGFWFGLGLRGRVFLVNTERVPPEACPSSLLDLADPRWERGETGMANPLFGTSATQAAALFAVLGPEKAREYYAALKGRGVRILDGNAMVRDRVAAGELAVGLTDTDDASGAVRDGAPVRVVFPDERGMGTLFIPNTVALVAGAPHPAEALKLLDFLLSSRTEARLKEAGFIHASVREPIKAMQVDWSEAGREWDAAQTFCRETFLR